MMDFKDELYEVLNKYNLSRTAKERIIEIMDKEKEVLLNILNKDSHWCKETFEYLSKNRKEFRFKDTPSIDDMIEMAKEMGAEVETVEPGKGGVYVLNENGKRVEFNIDMIWEKWRKDHE